MTMLKAIVFDFDGVILESMDIKTKAFAKLFADFPEHVEGIVKLHLDKGGISRFEKFKIIYRDFLKKPLDDAELGQLGQRFSDLVLEEVLHCPFVSGAHEFLEQYFRRYALFVASGTPETELLEIVARRKLNLYFQGVYGSPKTKAQIIRGIMVDNGLGREEIIFIGDALSDYAASQEASVNFVGRTPITAGNPFPATGVLAIVRDLRHLDEQWPRLCQIVN